MRKSEWVNAMSSKQMLIMIIIPGELKEEFMRLDSPEKRAR